MRPKLLLQLHRTLLQYRVRRGDEERLMPAPLVTILQSEQERLRARILFHPPPQIILPPLWVLGELVLEVS